MGVRRRPEEFIDKINAVFICYTAVGLFVALKQYKGGVLQLKVTSATVNGSSK